MLALKVKVENIFLSLITQLYQAGKYLFDWKTFLFIFYFFQFQQAACGISLILASRRGILRCFRWKDTHAHLPQLIWQHHMHKHINDSQSLGTNERNTEKLGTGKKHATVALYTACFHSLLCVSTQFPASSAPSWRYYLSVFLLHRHDEGCIKLAAWQGERVRGQHRGPCFKKKKSRHPQPQLSPPMSPSHNTESDIESRGLLFKIAAHRHSSEDLNNQLWKGKKKKGEEKSRV